MFKIIVINKSTANALRSSIATWKKKLERAKVEVEKEDSSWVWVSGCRECGLCRQFNAYSKTIQAQERPGRNCDECPICLDTGEQYCSGTPYDAFAGADYLREEIEFGEREIAYLENLQSRCVVQNGVRNHVQEALAIAA